MMRPRFGGGRVTLEVGSLVALARSLRVGELLEGLVLRAVAVPVRRVNERRERERGPQPREEERERDAKCGAEARHDGREPFNAASRRSSAARTPPRRVL